MSDKSDAEQRQTLRKIINEAHTAFLVTNNQVNGPHGRPMATAQVTESLDTFWFATDRNSPKIAELKTDDRVFLGYVNGSDWATVTGRGQVVDDRSKSRELWTDLWKNWFDGPDDPKLVLIAVTPTTAEYWDAANRAVVLAKMAFTAVTGKRTDVSDHAKVSL